MTNRSAILVAAVALATAVALASAGQDLKGLAGAVSERDALMALYDSTNGPKWKNNDNWGSSKSYCKWHGVTCSWFGFGGVKTLDLADNGLDGTLPAELAALSGLEELELSTSNLEGSLPPEWGKLKKLESLRINTAYPRPEKVLSGGIPDEWKGMTSLSWLFLNGHDLSGPIPEWMGDLPELRELALANNKLEGSLPESLARSKITNWTLGGNRFSGPIPSWLMNHPYASNINMDNAGFTGSIPEIKNPSESKIISIYLNQNQLEGPLPASIGQLPKLEYLYLEENKLTGPIPDFSGKIISIRLNKNQLEGPIPASIGQLPKLDTLNLDENKLTGPIPDFSGTKLTYLSLGNQGLEGGIENLCTAPNIDSLSIGGNPGLTGVIPDCLVELPNLTALWMSGTSITDEILPGGDKEGFFLKLKFCWLPEQLKCPISDELREHCSADCVEN